ncbi:MAG: hypothetical protein ACHREM_18140, partial [Polyangiales bacterium]
AAPTAPSKTPDVTVDVADLLKAYTANEVRADGKFKGKRLRVSGLVGEIKKDITEKIFVTLGTGAELEVPEAQCFFGDEHTDEAAGLSRGDHVTFDCDDVGLTINVILQDCSIAPSEALRVCNALVAKGAVERCASRGRDFAIFGRKGAHVGGLVQHYDEKKTFDALLQTTTKNAKAPPKAGDLGPEQVYSSAKARVIVSWQTDTPDDTNVLIRAVVDGL